MTKSERVANIEMMIQQARGDVGTSPVRNGGKQPKGTTFAALLYEDCVEHMEMLKYITTRNYYRYVYIKHDRDVWTETDEEVKDGKYAAGELKKAHYHIMWKVKNPCTAQSQQNYFCTWIKHVELVTSVDSYIRYMIHDTPASMHKTQYDNSELIGDERLLISALGDESIRQNRNFV